MPTVDLTGPAADQVPESAAGAGLLGLPRRFAVTLPELRFLADAAGGAPLPFDVTPAAPTSGLDDRLGGGRGASDDDAYAAVLDGLRDPVDSLHRRGLLTDGTADREVLSAFGILAAPTLAVDLDVAVDDGHARSWHRQTSRAVATLSTTDGVVFELAWFTTAQWARELALVATLPEDLESEASGVPDVVDLPYELLDGAAEAVRDRRPDLLPVLAAGYAGQVRDGADDEIGAADVPPLLTALVGEAHGRLRGLAADVSDASAPVVGVVSWVLVSDGWRALTTRDEDGVRRLRVSRVAPDDLPPLLAPVLREVQS